MKELDELKRLLAAATPVLNGLQMARSGSAANEALVDAAVSALPDLIAEIERLSKNESEAWETGAQFYERLKAERSDLVAAEITDRKIITRLEAALREIEAIEFGRGLEVAKQIARNARPEK